MTPYYRNAVLAMDENLKLDDPAALDFICGIPPGPFVLASDFDTVATELGSLVADHLRVLVAHETLKAELQAAREALREMREAEWMVTHDWGGDRQAVLDKVDAVLNDPQT